MLPSTGSKRKWVVEVVLALFALSMAAAAWAAGTPTGETQTIRRLSLLVGKSIVLKSEEAVKRISIADPAVADFVLISPSEIYITGKAAGTTNMTLWRAKGDYRVFDLDVGFDVSRLKQQLNEIMPEEADLRVTATQGAITLSGRVSSAANLSQALSLARAYVPEEEDDGGGGEVDKPKVINLVEVRGVQQVMLEVRVAEMQRSLARRMGVNFNYLTESGKFGISQLGNLTELVDPDDANIGGLPALIAPFATLVSPNVNAILRFSSNGTTWTGFIDALKADGLVKVLAEPTLIALSGQEANFLAGGEFPVPVPQGLGTVAIEYREFGVGLTFKPTVLSDNKINIEVAPEVSELDFSTAVQFSGFIVPGLSTRKTRTVVELADGQSFAIAGLLRDTARDSMSKYPLLGDLPILGVLFRSRSFQRNETELVIIATPRLVKPLDTARQPLPTDFYRMPNDMEFYVLGMMEGQGGQRTDGLQGDLDGEFGHSMPGRP
jgi:pilus assembly protein CpaC